MDSHELLVKASENRGQNTLSRLVSQMQNLLLDLVYPAVCLACRVPVLNRDGVCSSCWLKLDPITAPLCPVLGLPFEVDLGEGALSAQALANPPAFQRARSAVHYSDFARMIVSRLKYGDQPELARFCAHIMVGAGAELFKNNPVLVPVPLHWRRQLGRRYNQSSELCKAIAKISGCELAPMLVVRKQSTRQQVGLNTLQRARNVQGAFAVKPQELENYAGRRLILVDDVITTGATVTSLTHALNRAGFDHIDVLSFARVVIGAEMPI